MFRSSYRRSSRNLKPIDDALFTPQLRLHLVKVYSTLASTLVFTVLGAVLESSCHFLGVLSTITMFLGIISLFFVRETHLALPILYAVNFCMGGSLSILNEVVGFEVIIFSLLATVGVFTCFSVAAMFISRNTTFLLSSLFSNLCFLLISLSIYNIFNPTELSVSAALAVSLFVVSLFVVYDTQLIIHSFTYAHDRNFVLHALLLYIDFVEIFIRICVILSKEKKKKN